MNVGDRIKMLVNNTDLAPIFKTYHQNVVSQNRCNRLDEITYGKCDFLSNNMVDMIYS